MPVQLLRNPSYIRTLIAYAKRKHVHPRTVLLLAGIGVTHTYYPTGEKSPQNGSQGRYDTF